MNEILDGKIIKNNYVLKGLTAILFEFQMKKCAICENPITFHGCKLDHNHKTDEVRGLLCNRCNYALYLVESHIKANLNWHLYNLQYNKSIYDYLDGKTPMAYLMRLILKDNNRKIKAYNKNKEKVLKSQITTTAMAPT